MKTQKIRRCGCASDNTDMCGDLKRHDYFETAKHTPGPWEITECPDDNNVGLYKIGKEKVYGHIALVSKIENAFLIAAAPELLEAAMELEDELSKIQFQVSFTKTITKLRAAIAKAEGE